MYELSDSLIIHHTNVFLLIFICLYYGFLTLLETLCIFNFKARHLPRSFSRGASVPLSFIVITFIVFYFHFFLHFGL